MAIGDEEYDPISMRLKTIKYEPGDFERDPAAVAVPVIEGGALVDYPTEAGKVVSMIAFGDRVLVACEYGVFEIVDGKMVRLRFVRIDGRQS